MPANPRPGRKRDDTLAETPSLISARKHRAKRAAQYSELEVWSLFENHQSIQLWLTRYFVMTRNWRRCCQTFKWLRTFLRNSNVIPFLFVYHQVLYSAISDLERGGDKCRVLQALYYCLSLSHFIDESYVDLLPAFSSGFQLTVTLLLSSVLVPWTSKPTNFISIQVPPYPSSFLQHILLLVLQCVLLPSINFIIKHRFWASALNLRHSLQLCILLRLCSPASPPMGQCSTIRINCTNPLNRPSLKKSFSGSRTEEPIGGISEGP